jgi:phosphoribosylformylglycinamidine cyclo-ligase
MQTTYKKSGVDIKAANDFISKSKRFILPTHTDAVIKDIGGFGSFFKIPAGYKEPVLVSSTDGVGTKLKIAFLLNKHDTVGIDLVAMNVNDVLCSGAKPLFFLDYIATGKMNKKTLLDIIKGISYGCRIADCSLIGGETAQMPNFYKEDEYDLAGFCVGIVERKNIIDGSKISVGDTIIGLESNGLHSNGFSLVRGLFSEKEIKTLWQDELLKPTRIYVQPVLRLLEKISVQGIAHITGGAFFQKAIKIVRMGLCLVIKKNSWVIPEVFNTIQARARLSFKQMYTTFNMGVGMLLVIKSSDTQKAIDHLNSMEIKNWVIGEVKKGNEKIAFISGNK